jgi:hypothetical protein
MEIQNFKKEEIINESDRFIYSNYVKNIFLVNITLVALGIGCCFIFDKYHKLDSKDMWACGLVFLFCVGYISFDIYKKNIEMKKRIKISEEVFITSLGYDFIAPYWMLSNGIKMYKDSLKRSKLPKKDITLGSKLIVNYLPQSKFVISFETTGDYYQNSNTDLSK